MSSYLKHVPRKGLAPTFKLRDGTSHEDLATS